MGIDKDDIPHLFDRFFRADKSRAKTDVEGFGLGLSIAKQIIDRHNGTISVESEINKVYEAVHRLNPLAVCFSVSTAPPLIPTIEATRKVKELGYTTIWGGMHTSVLPEIALTEPALDYAIMGDGEIPIVELLAEIKSGKKNFGG